MLKFTFLKLIFRW